MTWSAATDPLLLNHCRNKNGFNTKFFANFLSQYTMWTGVEIDHTHHLKEIVDLKRSLAVGDLLSQCVSV